MPYAFVENRIGLPPITDVDTGFTPPNSTTAIPTTPATLGMVARAFDPLYGEGEFILLLGVAGTSAGIMVTYSTTTYQTALATTATNFAGPFAVAMSTNLAGTFGWYQISGLAVMLKTAVAVAPNVAMFQSATAGRVMPTVSAGNQLLGARSANLATVASGVSTVIVSINRPHRQGQIT